MIHTYYGMGGLIRTQYVRIYVYTYLHTYQHTNLHTYIHTYMHTYVHTYIHTYIQIYTYIHIHTHTHIHIHSFIYKHIHKHVTFSSSWRRSPRATACPSPSRPPPPCVSPCSRKVTGSGVLSMAWKKKIVKKSVSWSIYYAQSLKRKRFQNFFGPERRPTGRTGPRQAGRNSGKSVMLAN
jgi:hypothetical protein